MKNLRLVLVVITTIFMLLANNKLNAASITSIEIAPIHKQKMIVLNLKAKGVGMINIKVLDQKQNEIFSEKLESVLVFEKKFNLKSLEEGDYFLSAEDDLKVTTYLLKVNAQKVEVDKEWVKSIRKPIVKLNDKEKQLDINWMMECRGTYQLIIKRRNDDFRFEDEIKGKVAIHRSYDTSKLKKGTYDLAIKNEKRFFYKTIEIR